MMFCFQDTTIDHWDASGFLCPIYEYNEIVDIYILEDWRGGGGGGTSTYSCFFV